MPRGLHFSMLMDYGEKYIMMISLLTFMSYGQLKTVSKFFLLPISSKRSFSFEIPVGIDFIEYPEMKFVFLLLFKDSRITHDLNDNILIIFIPINVN